MGEVKNKAIFLDGGAFLFNSIHLHGTMVKKKMEGLLSSKAFIAPIGYTYMSMLISALKRIGVNKDDIVIVCIDARNSWRRAFLNSYKGQRAEARKKQSHINWTKAFAEIEDINNKLNLSTDWHFLKFDNVINLLDILQTKDGENLIGDDYQDYMFEKDYGYESDDIQSVGCRYFKDREVILVTGDKDLYQLAFYPNVKIYSLNLKKIKGGKGGYAFIPDPLKILQDKIRLGDISDNIIVDKLRDTPLEQERREYIINLLRLPDWLESDITKAFDNLPKKEVKPKLLPYQNSLAKRFFDIYKKDKIITFEYCKQLVEKRELKKKAKAKERAKEKKLEKYKDEFLNKPIYNLTKKDWRKLERAGFLYMFYPEAPNSFEDLEKLISKEN